MPAPPRAVEIIDRQLAYQGYLRVEQMTLRHSREAGDMTPKLQREAFF